MDYYDDSYDTDNNENDVKISNAKMRRMQWNCSAWFEYLKITDNVFWRTLWAEPSRLVFNPISTTRMVVASVIVRMVGFVIVIGLFLMKITGIFSLLNSWRVKYGESRSFTTMDDPEMFVRYSDSIENAKKIFEKGYSHKNSEMDTARRVRYFDVDVAKTLLLFSAAMYERDEELMYDTIIKAHDSDADRDGMRYDEYITSQNEAEREIKNLAKSWGVKFAGVSDLNTYGGSYCGLWWDPNANWIVVSFKGTTPDSSAEWLKDLTLNKTNANAFLFGNVHQGFYNMLFPDKSQVPFSPYGSIMKVLKEKATHLQRRTNKNVNVYITGHSLGAAIATAFYSRVMKSPSDFGPKNGNFKIKLRSGYVFGAPRIGDVDFCSGFYSKQNCPFANTQILYRVINKWDIVGRVPIGEGDDTTKRDFLTKQSLFNYGHVGDEVLLWGEDKCELRGNCFAPGCEIKIVHQSQQYNYDNIVINNNTSSSSSSSRLNPKNPKNRINPPKRNIIHFVEWFIPSFLFDHLPSGYMASLDKLTPTATPDYECRIERERRRGSPLAGGGAL